MKISKVSNQNFQAFIAPPPAIYNHPVPAIIKTIGTKTAQQTTRKSLPKISATQLNIPTRDYFILHEAVVTDPRIKVVGLPSQKKISSYPPQNLKGPGKKHIKSIWLHR